MSQIIYPLVVHIFSESFELTASETSETGLDGARWSTNQKESGRGIESESSIPDLSVFHPVRESAL
jgi:hypothetical protein